MNELIRKLKDKNKAQPFGMRTSEEQAFFKRVGKENCLYFGEDGWDETVEINWPFATAWTYIIKPDYQSKPEYDDKNKDLLSICREHARKFRRQTNAPFDELVSAAYLMAWHIREENPEAISLRSSITWALIRHTRWVRGKRKNPRGDKYPLENVDYRDFTRSSEIDPSTLILIKEQNNLLIKAVSKLETSERELIYWRYRDDKTYPEIGEMLYCSKTHAKKLITDVLTKLREELEDLGDR